MPLQYGAIKNRDRWLLANLRDNSRRSLSGMSRSTKIPLTTVFENLKKLEARYVMKYVSLLDFCKLNMIRVNIAVKSGGKSKESLRDFLLQHGNVNTLQRLNNSADYFIDAVFQNMKELNSFLEAIDRFQVEEKKVFYIVDALKLEEFFTTKDLNLLD